MTFDFVQFVCMYRYTCTSMNDVHLAYDFVKLVRIFWYTRDYKQVELNEPNILRA